MKNFVFSERRTRATRLPDYKAQLNMRMQNRTKGSQMPPFCLSTRRSKSGPVKMEVLSCNRIKTEALGPCTYRVTNQVAQNLLLTSNQVRPKRSIGGFSQPNVSPCMTSVKFS